MDIRCTDSIRPIEHARTKNKPIAPPSSLILPLFPNKVTARIPFSRLTRHDGAHHDCDEDASQNEEEAEIGDRRECAVGEHDAETTRPGDDKIGDEYVPGLVCIVGVEETVHGNYLVGDDRGHACGFGSKEVRARSGERAAAKRLEQIGLIPKVNIMSISPLIRQSKRW